MGPGMGGGPPGMGGGPPGMGGPGIGPPGMGGPQINEDIKVPDKMVGLSEFLIIFLQQRVITLIRNDSEFSRLLEDRIML